MPANPQSDSEPTPGLDLDALRERLRAARAQRGACPPWEELRADHLPGGSSRPGREERAAHRALCPYCDAHVLEWQNGPDRTVDTLEAVERHVARGVVEGARRLIALAGPRADGAATRPAPAEPVPPPPVSAAPFTPKAPPPRPVPTPTYVPPPPVSDWNAPPPTLVRRERGPSTSPPPAPPPTFVPPAPPPTFVPPPPPPTFVPPRPAPPVPVAAAELRLLVVEATAPERIPPSVFLCAQVLGAEVAHVARVDELAGDPDLDAVCAIVFAGARPAAEWPEALRRGRDLAPGRPVLILAGGGALPTGGARRALGDALLSLDDPAELLLVALDPRLR